MAKYLTTKELARHLRINEKKVYDLVSRGRIPAARISGKWLFPRRLVDEWVESNTIHPASGVMGAVLDRMVVMQGSDDWLLARVIERFLATEDLPVVSANVGSIAGLAAMASGTAHLAGCHVGNEDVERTACRNDPCYLVNLFDRHQGLILDRSRHRGVKGLRDVVSRKLRFAERQPLSGTYRLVARLAAEQGVSLQETERLGPFSEHLALALAVRTGRADAGVGIRVAAEQCGLDFVPLCVEQYKLAIPKSLFSNPQMMRLLDFVLAGLGAESRRGVAGYEFSGLGRLETVGRHRNQGQGARA